MTHQLRLVLVLIGLCLVSLLPGMAWADAAHEHTQFGRNITIGPGEQASGATCFGCSIRVRGQVETDVVAFGGSVVIEDGAHVGGDITVFDGDVRLERGASVQEINIFGGGLHRDPGAIVQGDVTTFGGRGWWILLMFGLPLVLLGAVIALIVWLVRVAIRPRVPVAA